MGSNQRGFTLIELMMVVAIIGVMAAVSAYNALEVLPRYQLHAAARDFSGNLRLARKSAIHSFRDVRVVFDQGCNTYCIDGRRTVPHSGTLKSHYGGGVCFGFGRATKSAAATSSKLPSSPITFQGNPRSVTFNQRGLSNAGTAYFTNKLGDCCAVVVSTSGRIRLRTWTGKKWR
jgi:prepilin-type N-terminal cleavage/methylation domain-containing protein